MTRSRIASAQFNVARLLALLILTWFGAAGLAPAQTPEIDQVNRTVDAAATALARVYVDLHAYDRILQMRVARGSLDSRQTGDMLRKRAEELAKGIVKAAAQVEEERQEAKLFFDAIERAAASANWPRFQKPEFYRAYAAVVLERVRSEHATALAKGTNAAQPLEDAYTILKLTRGQEDFIPSPFSNPVSRISSAMDMPSSSRITPATVQSRLEPNVRRSGQDIAVVQTADPAECQAACQKDGRCRSFSFQYPADEGQKGVCSLKGVVPPREADDCCVSWVAPTQIGRMLGCFRDTNAPFDLDGYLERSRENSSARCVAICQSKGFRFAGVQYGESCLCGNSYGRYGAASNCTTACTGRAGEACGGSNASNVYATGL